MLYLIIKQDARHLRAGTQSWQAMFRNQKIAMQVGADTELQPGEILMVVEINPIESTWRTIRTRINHEKPRVASRSSDAAQQRGNLPLAEWAISPIPTNE